MSKKMSETEESTREKKFMAVSAIEKDIKETIETAFSMREITV
jgi:hypothetical protein